MKMVMNQFFTVNKSDERVILLNAMKPFLSDGRKSGIEEVSKMLGIVGFLEKMIHKAGV